MVDAELDAGRIEDGAVLMLKEAPERWNAGDVIVVRRDGTVVTELTSLDEKGEFSWKPSAWTDLHIRLERVDNTHVRIWLRPHHKELLSRMKTGGYP
jgi:hypothetical protein